MNNNKDYELTDEDKVMNLLDGGVTEVFLQGDNSWVPQVIDDKISSELTLFPQKKDIKKSIGVLRPPMEVCETE